MDNEIELVADKHGVAVIGDSTAVDLFLRSEGLASRDLGLPRLQTALSAGAGLANAGSEVAANYGRWVKLTERSAEAMRGAQMMKGSGASSVRAVVTDKGKIKSILEISTGPGSALSNPALVSGVGGIMAQAAMQQAMDEITAYLERIEEKVDDVLRAQTDQVLARMIGVGLVIDETMTIREKRGRVDDVTWSKVQAAPTTIAETQAYAVRQMEAVAQKLEHKGTIADAVKVATEAEVKTREWLAVLARTFQLQDALAVLELDRVLDAAPAELDAHRQGLEAAREQRLALVAETTERLVVRMKDAAARANSRVLFNPFQSPAVVASSNHVVGSVIELHSTLGLGGESTPDEARRWADAATEVRDKAWETGAGGVDAARRMGSDSLSRARSVGDKVSSGLSARTRWRRTGHDGESE